MFKFVTTAVLAAALSLGSPAAPARADSGETARLIAGLTLLAIIAGAATKSKGKDHGVEVGRVAPVPVYPKPDRHTDRSPGPDRDYRNYPDPREDWGRDGHRDDHHDWRHDRRQVQVLPSECARTVRGAEGYYRTVYQGSCMTRYGIRNLPSACGFDIKLNHTWRRVYGLNCLERSGFFVASRR